MTWWKPDALDIMKNEKLPWLNKQEKKKKLASAV
jgi:hypothetical protein